MVLRPTARQRYGRSFHPTLGVNQSGAGQTLARATRRRMLVALLLLPSVGCATGSLSLALPWMPEPSAVDLSDPSEPPEVQLGGSPAAKATKPETAAASPETARVVAKKPSIFQFAAARLQRLDEDAMGEDFTAELSSPLTDSDDLDFERADSIEAEPPERADSTTQNTEIPPLLDAGSGIDESSQVIDLSSALGMAGGNAWSVQLARQRTVEAHANLEQARVMWLPSLQLGIGWNKHDGRIQATDGQVIQASRGSLFLGGGAVVGGSPAAGGSGGPLRLAADLALADTYFAPKVALRQFHASQAAISVARNKALLDAGLAYLDLVEARGQVADAQAAINAATELLRLTQTFAEAGAGAQADVDRAATEQARLNQVLADANRLLRTRSALLARRLRLDPRFDLQPADQFLVPIELNAAVDRDTLIGEAMSNRPEINQRLHEIAGLCLNVRKAEIEPWIPKVAMTTSAGSFGGGNGGDLGNRDGRADIDLQAVWEIENLGLGNAARRTRAGSQLAQQRSILSDLRDELTTQVIAAYEDVVSYRAQIESANATLALAQQSYERNLQRVQADEGLPIELLQAISAQAAGLRIRTTAVANYNRAQIRLLYAAGKLQ